MTFAAEADEGIRFAHEALIYDRDDEYVDVLVPFLREGLATGGVAVAVVPARKAALLSQALGDDRDRVEIIDADSWYQHPSRTIAQYDAVLCSLAKGVRAWVVGEVRFGDSSHEWAQWTRYEAALNRALEHHDAHVICPYDIRLLPQGVVDDARCTHHHVLEGDGDRRTVAYIEPESFIPRLALVTDLPAGVPDIDVRLEPNTPPGPVRAAVVAAAGAAGFSADRTAELTVAVNEVVTNALSHGEGAVHVQIWISPEHEITCAVHDRGAGVDDPLVGLCPPRHGARGTGLWVVRQLVDQVELIPQPGAGFTVVLTAAP